ncbi:MAG: M48 family metalloprotease [Alcanivoracaceae bacterium]|nr:M48 family metalloprotease [Alcanivoracaceae bacterium]
MDLKPLSPPPYLSSIVELLKQSEPELWKWFHSHKLDPERMGQTRLQLLKATYRIEPEEESELYLCAARVAERLGIEAPVTFYQAQDGGQINAMLFYIPGEVHIIFSGSLLNSFSVEELEVIIGHELSHFLMWTEDDQDYLVAEQVLNALANDAQAEACHAESARLYRLFTEVYCDRGALHVSGDLSRCITTLVRVDTGLARVSAQSYLKQSEEILDQEQEGSSSLSHPESFMRAKALQLWAEQVPALEQQIEKMIRGPEKLVSLDMISRNNLMALTQEFVNQFLFHEWIQTESTLSHARLFSQDYKPHPPSRSDEELIVDLKTKDNNLRQYYCYIMLDFVCADAELEEYPLAHAVIWARKLGLEKDFAELAVKEMRLTKKKYTEIAANAEKLLEKVQVEKEVSA